MTAEEFVTLRDYIDTRILELDRRIVEAYVTMRDLTELVNELRQETLPRNYYDERHRELADRVDRLEGWRSNIMGRAVAVGVLGTLFVAAVTALGMHFAMGG